jgi:alpha-1,2-mannosyltransferase
MGGTLADCCNSQIVVRGGALLLLPQRGFAFAMVAIFALAVAARLVPVLHGGGLGGLGNYDDGVHFSAATGLVHGLFPYRDFLLLHPPGIVVLLSPFAMVGSVLGDATGMKMARVAWMTLGGANAILTGVVLRPLGRAAALLGALFYALFFPAIYSEHTLLLEAPATTALLGSLVLLRALDRDASVSMGTVLIAGAVAGVSPAIKIWGVVPVLLVVGWLAFARGWRPAGRYLVGAVLSCAAICLPFFLAAPAPMWRMVVRDQLGRRPRPWEPLERINQLAGLSLHGHVREITVATVVALLVVTAAVLACSLRRGLRLPVVLVSGTTILLMTTPTWFLHYTGLIAAPAALLLGSAAAAVFDRLRGWGGQQAVVVATAAASVALLMASYPLTDARLGGRRFPGRSLEAAVASQSGCVTTDLPTTLIQMNALSRNIERGCRFEVDLGGWSNDLGSRAVRRTPRPQNALWQQFALDYLRSGDAALIVRFERQAGFSAASTKTCRGWPKIHRVGDYVLREPQS